MARKLIHDIDQGRLSGQAAFEQMVALHAAGQIGTQQMLTQAKAAEAEKLGVNGTARKTAVDTWAKATLGEELGKHFSDGLFTARQVEAVEKIMAAFRTQGAGTFSHTGREPAEPGRVSDAEYNKMTYSEQKAYSAKFPQNANAA